MARRACRVLPLELSQEALAKHASMGRFPEGPARLHATGGSPSPLQALRPPTTTNLCPIFVAPQIERIQGTRAWPSAQRPRPVRWRRRSCTNCLMPSAAPM